jgi:hypothetical protein
MAIARLEKIVYRTSNGVEFDTLEKAEEYERRREIVEVLDASDIYWRDTSPEEVVRVLEKRFHFVPKVKADA